MLRNIMGGMALFVLSFTLLSGCSNNNNPVSGALSPNGTAAPNVSLSIKFSNTTTLPKTNGIQAVDSIVITRARFVLRDLKLGSDSENKDYNMDTDVENKDNKNENDKHRPTVVDLNLSSALQQIAVANLPAGTYNKVKFEIHKVSQTEVNALPASEQPKFADFLSGAKYSVLVDGKSYNNGTVTDFNFKSQVEAEVDINLTKSLIVTANTTTLNITLDFNSNGWFKDSSGKLIDPSDPNNLSLINNNIRKSMKVYEDDNKDGNEDD
ncbi:MAG: hypothetical protein GXO79_07455 [Chlorobi bacterium]|nr:hypothetical protein [Chlorobiota bacterium]